MHRAIFGIAFKDNLSFDPKTRTLVSVRDGIMRYKGHELGVEPADKVFTVYRSPETIKAINDLMPGIPITDGHVDTDRPPDNPVGKVLDSEIIQFEEEDTKATLNLRNKVELNFDTPFKDLSLAGACDFVDCELYDFEQVGMVPHHLAIVSKGRCGEQCNFKDKENETMKLGTGKGIKVAAVFLDAGEEVNMAQVMDIVANLPEAIKTMPIKELAKLVPILQKVTTQATQSVAEGEILSPEEAEAAKVAKEEEATATADAALTATESEKKEMADKDFADSLGKGIEKGVKAGTAEYAVVMAKAVDFLPDTYNFADKCACDIMRDALATQSKDDFKDDELSVAFKMLKKGNDYSKFADGANDASKQIDEMGDKEL